MSFILTYFYIPTHLQKHAVTQAYAQHGLLLIQDFFHIAKARRMAWVEYVAHMREMTACNILVRAPERKRPLARLRLK
jgi:hypothetical protein